MGRKKIYTDEELKERQLEACKKWYWSHKEFKNERWKEWYDENKEKRSEYNKKWREEHKEYDKERRKDYAKTPIGRASSLANKYKGEDKKHNRGECTLTKEWIMKNIFSKPCVHCGKEGWNVIGCNRLDNSKPHTEDNVEPCCEECNKKMWFKEMGKEVYQYNLDGRLVKIWNSTQECEKNGFSHSKVSACCIGKRKTHKGFKWSYTPL